MMTLRLSLHVWVFSCLLLVTVTVCSSPTSASIPTWHCNKFSVSDCLDHHLFPCNPSPCNCALCTPLDGGTPVCVYWDACRNTTGDGDLCTGSLQLVDNVSCEEIAANQRAVLIVCCGRLRARVWCYDRWSGCIGWTVLFQLDRSDWSV